LVKLVYAAFSHGGSIVAALFRKTSQGRAQAAKAQRKIVATLGYRAAARGR
jgi:hypothetical protein